MVTLISYLMPRAEQPFPVARNADKKLKLLLLSSAFTQVPLTWGKEKQK